jgi:hypothetical protein
VLELELLDVDPEELELDRPPLELEEPPEFVDPELVEDAEIDPGFPPELDDAVGGDAAPPASSSARPSSGCGPDPTAHADASTVTNASDNQRFMRREVACPSALRKSRSRNAVVAIRCRAEAHPTGGNLSRQRTVRRVGDATCRLRFPARPR